MVTQEGNPERSREATRDGTLALLTRVYERFTGINGHIYAAAISYFSLISLFPWLIFLVTMLTLIVRDPALQSQIITQVVDQFPPGARIRGELRAFVSEITVRRSGLLGIIGLIATIIVASEAFRALRFALNAIFGITQTRSVLRGRAIDLLGMVVVLVFGTIAAAITGFLSLDWAGPDHWFVWVEGTLLMKVMQYVLPFLLSFVAFVLMYRVVPEAHLPWSVLWIPGLIAATGLELARLGMGLFLTYFERFQQLYGALSVTIVALVFVFLVANIVLLAAALACEISSRRERS